ncbi:MAG: hypothetical protein OXC60_10420 [Litoreibacter sp.]|nr:hypothetical protein [Litoreibacter sp.]MCY4335073.1 hypothetical protein [Litoreibacter sp.]
MSPSTDMKIAEIVRFKLKPGVSDADYLALTEPSHAYAGGMPGFLSRNLSKGDDGEWTDYVIWENLDSARAASEGFMAQDFAPAMVDAIDKATMRMTHQHILWQPA